MAIGQTPDGRWFVEGRPGFFGPDDPKRRREYFGRGADGERAAHRRNEELKRPSIRLPPAITFVEIAAAYRTSREGINTPATLRNLDLNFDRVICPLIGNTPAMLLTHDRLDEYCANRRRDGVKGTTIHRELCDIRAALNWAVKRRMISHSPMAGYEMPRRDDAPIKGPSEREIARILGHSPDHLRRFIWIATYCGVRPGPVEMGIRWDDIDWMTKTLLVRSALKGGKPKRLVPLHRQIFEKLQEWHEADEGGKVGDGWVIHWRGGPVRCIMTAWKNAKEKAGIKRQIRPYDLRHSFIAFMIESGADLGTIAEIAGHDIATMLKNYPHVSASMRRSAIDSLPDLL